jgi:AcrR family transcriptional regulator
MSRQASHAIPAGNRRQIQKAETRAIILTCARRLFEERGYDQTTIRAVAQAAGVGLGTIFLHFTDKTALLSAALYDDLEKTLEDAFNSLPENTDVCDQFLYIAARLYRYYARRTALSRVFLKQVLFLSDTTEHPLELRFINALVLMLEDAQKQGELNPDTDCGLTANIFIGQYLYVLYLGLMAPEFDPAESIALLRRCLLQIMHGIGKRSFGNHH